MRYFEKELKKLVDQGLPLKNVTYAGRSCYGRLAPDIRARMEFASPEASGHYSAIRVTLLNRREGPIDSMLLRFSDALGIKKVQNPNFREGIVPYIWENGNEVEWYVYHPTTADYKRLAEEIGSYMDVFQEEEMTQSHKMEGMTL